MKTPMKIITAYIAIPTPWELTMPEGKSGVAYIWTVRFIMSAINAIESKLKPPAPEYQYYQS
ncbi:MAG: hypothetical protein DRO62_03720, partial [Candidatus Altiarchaeales archaeon]